MDIYDRLGVRKIINAWGTITLVGGSRMPPEAYQAIAEAGQSFVFLDELQQKAGAYLAGLLGVEAAYICSGAAGGMVLAAAACLTGTDQQKIWALPETEGWRNEIIVQREKGPNYVYQGMRHTGACLVPAGTPQELTTSDIERALSDKTAAIMLYLGVRRQPAIAEVAPIARRAGVPLIVDAAAEMPPRANFTEPLGQGADLIIFSGGKGLLGPQSTGLILGRKELIEACRLNGNPFTSIGRPMKVGKEEICALVAAVERFMARDEQAELAEYTRRATCLAEGLAGIAGITPQVLPADPRARPVVPRLYIDLQPGFTLSGKEICQRMLEGNPPIAIGETNTGVRVDVMLLTEAEVEIVARRLREVFEGGE